MKRGFTLVEVLTAVMILGIVSAIAFGTYRTITNGWRSSREYMDKLQRSDYAFDQLVSGLKSAYYPRSGQTSVDYGFKLEDKGGGETPRESDVIEWTKRGPALIGGSAVADSVHRVQVMVLEEGDTKWNERIETTGLYARVRPLAKVMSRSTGDAEKFTFENEELYRPILIAKDVVGFDCRVQAEEPKDSDGKKQDKDLFEDEYTVSNSIPHKVHLTFYVLKEDPQYASQRRTVPIMRIVRMPLHEQSLDAAPAPGETKENSGAGGRGRGGARK